MSYIIRMLRIVPWGRVLFKEFMWKNKNMAEPTEKGSVLYISNIPYGCMGQCIYMDSLFPFGIPYVIGLVHV